jgi:hypothetical protein
MWKKLILVAASAVTLANLSACIVAPPAQPAPRAYHDRDHDGVPNRRDRDRDGDGVPNRYDARPDNPYRR